jgi:hypothetical protein
LYFDNARLGVMALALFVITLGCLITVGRRLNRIAHALK